MTVASLRSDLEAKIFCSPCDGEILPGWGDSLVEVSYVAEPFIREGGAGMIALLDGFIARFEIFSKTLKLF